MNTYRYDEQKRRLWVREKNNGTKSVRQICKEAGVSRATLYNWIKEFPDAVGEEVVSDEGRERLVSHEYEPAEKYEMLVAALSLVDSNEHMARKMVQTLVKRYTLTVAQACALVGIEEDSYGYKPRKPEVDDQLVYDELSRLITEDRSRGFIECYGILQQTHPGWTRKQIKRVYKIGRLYLKRLHGRARKNQQEEGVVPVAPDVALRPQRPDATWNLGLITGAQDRWTLFITDDQDQALLNAATGTGFPDEAAIFSFLSGAVAANGKPRKLRVPGKKPFDTREITRWIWENKVALHTLSLSKEENVQEVQTREAEVRSQLGDGAFDAEGIERYWSLQTV